MSGYNVQTPSTFVVQPVPLAPEWLPGMMMPYAGPVAPPGWLVCNGQSLLRSQYLALFEVIGTTYGADDSEHFTLPDCRGNVIIGKGTQSYCNALGETGGEQEHTLTIGEMPSHNHAGTTDSAGSHTHTLNNATTVQINGVNTPSGLDNSGGEINCVNTLTATVNANGAHTHTFTTGNTGGGAAHNNLQPYITLNYIIRFIASK